MMRVEPMMEPREFFDLSDQDYRDVFDEDAPVWRTLDRLKEYINALFEEPWPLKGTVGQLTKSLVIVDGAIRDDLEVGPHGPKGRVVAIENGEVLEGAAVIMAGAHLFDDRIILGAGSVVEPGALLKGPFVVGRGTEIRQGAYVRGTCLVGSDCVVGHATETKASIMLDGAKAGHFAYIGDSILGRDVNLGAGTKLANLKMIPGTVMLREGDIRHDTGRRKLGAILGDSTEAGCNSVTSPGTLLGPSSIVYPTVTVPAGFYPGMHTIRPGRNSVLIRCLSR
jgi:UDP-N-acetylglucosamine diphosphorylase / glucose-1-phosphate thymidylyltransferase / UDP-N-acetylgalactosamine diphosphorylase / glucosamine-1-phosphate N-acetyltransferase / galactosamine-1-phosphate N-acetyltransferase